MSAFPFVVSRQNADLQVVNTTTETEILEFTTLANWLSGDHGYRVTLDGGALNNSGGDANCVFRVNFGATVIWEGTQLLPATATPRTFRMVIELMAKDSDAIQEMFGSIICSAGSTGIPTIGEGGGIGGNMYGDSAEDCTVDQLLTVTAELDVADPDTSITRRRFMVEYL